MSSDGGSEQIGKGRPPVTTRFAKGQSGNARGRPRGRKQVAPYETVLGQQVTVREEGGIRRMSAAEAFLLHVTRLGLQGDGPAARATMTAIEEAQARRGAGEEDRITVIIRKFVSVGSVNGALEKLGAATTLDPYRETARLALEPWLVELALSKLGDRKLSSEEQRTVWRSTRTPWKVHWPEWWTFRG
jgi:hypothetical protein